MALQIPQTREEFEHRGESFVTPFSVDPYHETRLLLKYIEEGRQQAMTT